MRVVVRSWRYHRQIGAWVSRQCRQQARSCKSTQRTARSTSTNRTLLQIVHHEAGNQQATASRETSLPTFGGDKRGKAAEMGWLAWRGGRDGLVAWCELACRGCGGDLPTGGTTVRTCLHRRIQPQENGLVYPWHTYLKVGKSALHFRTSVLNILVLHLCSKLLIGSAKKLKQI
jgi:hypothetical protein